MNSMFKKPEAIVVSARQVNGENVKIATADFGGGIKLEAPATKNAEIGVVPIKWGNDIWKWHALVGNDTVAEFGNAIEAYRARPSKARFAGVQTETFEWNDRQGRRDRQQVLRFFTPDRVLTMTEAEAAGLIVTETLSYVKDGKWSSTTFRITTAAGVKWVNLQQDWGTGEWTNVRASIQGIAADFGMQGVSQVAMEEYLFFHHARTYRETYEKMAALARLEEVSVDRTEVTFTKGHGTRRQGDNAMVVDGILVALRKTAVHLPDDIIVVSETEHTISFSIPASAEVWFGFEYEAYGVPGLEQFGYTQNQRDYTWSKQVSETQPQPRPQPEIENMTGALAALKAKFAK